MNTWPQQHPLGPAHQDHVMLAPPKCSALVHVHGCVPHSPHPQVCLAVIPEAWAGPSPAQCPAQVWACSVRREERAQMYTAHSGGHSCTHRPSHTHANRNTDTCADTHPAGAPHVCGRTDRCKGPSSTNVSSNRGEKEQGFEGRTEKNGARRSDAQGAVRGQDRQPSSDKAVCSLAARTQLGTFRDPAGQLESRLRSRHSPQHSVRRVGSVHSGQLRTPRAFGELLAGRTRGLFGSRHHGLKGILFDCLVGF